MAWLIGVISHICLVHDDAMLAAGRLAQSFYVDPFTNTYLQPDRRTRWNTTPQQKQPFGTPISSVSGTAQAWPPPGSAQNTYRPAAGDSQSGWAYWRCLLPHALDLRCQILAKRCLKIQVNRKSQGKDLAFAVAFEGFLKTHSDTINIGGAGGEWNIHWAP